MKNLPSVGVAIELFCLIYMLVMPALQPTRKGRRHPCNNNLRNISLALQNYHGQYGSFPPAILTDDQGRPMHSWRVLLLPYLDEAELYGQIRLNEPWNSPHNAALADKIPQVYRCPNFDEYHMAHGLKTDHTRLFTNYVLIVADDAVFTGGQPTTVADITDGHSNTILAIEVRQHAVHWMQPNDVSESEALCDLQVAKKENQGNHVGCVMAAFADGRVRHLTSTLDPKIFHALITRHGGEDIGEF
jgi:Protein of unknown function (DUF1559)